jgi:electron transport complex protein RnfC
MILKTTSISSNKNELAKLPSTHLEDPEFVFIPLTNSRCASATLSIKENDKVYLGEKIGLRKGPFFDQPFFSTVSGTYLALEKHGYRNGKVIDYLKIKNDHKDTKDPSLKGRDDKALSSLTKDDLIAIAKEKALVGLGGSSFPSYIKLACKSTIKTILINGIECEPYLTSDQRFMEEHADEIIGGIKLLMHAYSCSDARLAIKATHQEVIAFFKNKLVNEKGIQVAVVKDFYPQGWEVAMIKSVLNIDVANGHLPSEYGVMDFNVATVASLYVAAKEDLPVLNRYVSVYGDGITTPSNYVVRVGTPMKTLIDKSGGFSSNGENKVLIIGGPMMGSSIPSEDCITSPTVTSILVLNLKYEQMEPCIRCTSCVLSCPEGLKPVTIMNLMRMKHPNAKWVNKFEPMKCVECGLCTYSCTSKIPLLYYIRQAKSLVRTLPKK